MLVRRELFRFIAVILTAALPAMCLAADPAPNPAAGSRIVDGALQDANDFPSVGMIVDTAHTFSCTGTLIDPTHVLTAAHCGVDESTNKMLPGNALNVTLGGTTYRSTKIFIHPTFNLNAIGNDGVIDVAIMELEKPVPGITPSPILRTQPIVGTPITLVGYGLFGKNKSTLKSRPPSGMVGVGANVIQTVTPTTIEWNFVAGTSSNAPGDSGGPAFINLNNQWVIAGITSLGETTGGKIILGSRNFDTRIDTITEWIDAVLTGNIKDAPPEVTSPITATPNPATTIDTVKLTVAATDPDDKVLFYVWDFGDGTAGTGANTTHNFPFPGTYNVTVTISDTVTGITSNANVVINPLATGNLKVDKLQIALNFAVGGKDSFSLQTHLSPPPPTGLPIQGILALGTNVQIPFSLDNNGKAKGAGAMLALNVQKGTFTASIKGADLALQLAGVGLIDANVSNAQVTVPVSLVLNGIVYAMDATLHYSAKQDKSGKAK